MAWLLVSLFAMALARPKVLDVPLQESGTGTICGDKTCSYCCLEGFVCATYMPDCAYISTEDYTERIIFIVFGSVFGFWVAIWLTLTVYRFFKNRTKLSAK